MLSKRDNISPEIKIDQWIYKTTHHKTSVCRRPGVTRIFNQKYDVLCGCPGGCCNGSTSALGRSKFPLASWLCPGQKIQGSGGLGGYPLKLRQFEKEDKPLDLPHRFKQSPMNHGWVAVCVAKQAWWPFYKKNCEKMHVNTLYVTVHNALWMDVLIHNSLK